MDACEREQSSGYVASEDADEPREENHKAFSAFKAVANAAVAAVRARRLAQGRLAKNPKASLFVADNTRDVLDSYEMGAQLGEGTYGSVYQGTQRGTGMSVAIKVIARKALHEMGPESFKKEVDIMKMLDHPNVCKLFDAFEDKANVYLATELCTGGQLFERIVDSKCFSESQAAIIMKQIFQAVCYMHEKHITHRDIKPENFIFSNGSPIDDSANVLKLIDFGLSTPFSPGEVLHTKAGTPLYIAPEVIRGKYDERADMWSCGVIMFVLLCGYPPFGGKTDADILSHVKAGTFNYIEKDWKGVSRTAKSLITRLIRVNVKIRLTAHKALEDEWIVAQAPLDGISLDASVVSNLRAFQSASKFKKMVLTVIAHQMNSQKHEELRKMFLLLDVHNRGYLTLCELKEGIATAGLEVPEDLDQLILEIDTHDTGWIEYTEFLAATMDKKIYLEEAACWSAFKEFDKDLDGKITRQELKFVLADKAVRKLFNDSSLSEMMQEADSNADGCIDFHEFVTIMRKEA